MRLETICLTCGFVIAAGLPMEASPTFAATKIDCNAPSKPTLKGAQMSEKLRRCNGVLKPSKAADPDIIIPAPKIDDPLMVHPKDLPKNKGNSK